MSELQGIRVGVNAAIVRAGAILLVAFDDEESGLHYNLPGGGVKPGEALHEALRREVHEETSADVEIGRLLLAWEYVPSRYAERYGPIQKLGLIFAAELQEGSEPQMPEQPDLHQVGVRWVALRDLLAAPLLPQIAGRLIAALRAPQQPDPFIEQI